MFMRITFSHAGLVDGEEMQQRRYESWIELKEKNNLHVHDTAVFYEPQSIFTSSSSTHYYVTVNL